MPALRHILVADVAAAAPRRGETVIWVGAAEPPPRLSRRRRVIKVQTSGDAAVLIGSSPAVLRFALRQPLGFIEALTTPARLAEARAA